MNNFISTLVFIMLLAGAVGGLINHFLIQEINPEYKFAWVKNVLVGIGASFLVPLFLNMISSNLIESIRGNDKSEGSPANYFVFAGFCLIAAISSRAFIKTISDKLLTEVKEAKAEAKAAKEEAKEAKKEASEVRENVEPIIEKESEPEIDQNADEDIFKSSAFPESATDIEDKSDEYKKKVIDAIGTSRFTYRSASKIAKEMNLNTASCRAILGRLEQAGLVATKTSKTGSPLYYLTPEGFREFTGSIK